MNSVEAESMFELDLPENGKHNVQVEDVRNRPLEVGVLRTGVQAPKKTDRVEAKSIFELDLVENGKRPAPIEDAGSEPLDVNVVCTSMPATVDALENAVELARGLHARLRLLVAQEVPYAVPLESPPVLVEFQEELFRRIAKGCGVDTRVDIFLCRDAAETFSQHLPSPSLIVMGSRRRWWPTREEKLARRLRRRGHEVLIVYGKENSRA